MKSGTERLGRLGKLAFGGLLVTVGLVGLITVSGFAGQGPDVARAAEAPGGLLEGVTAMLQEHMGLDATEAADWAGDMAEHMEAVHGENADEMLQYCTDAYADGDADGAGMMDGYGTGMMGGYGSDGSYGGMMDGYGGGMMGGGYGGMMGF